MTVSEYTDGYYTLDLTGLLTDPKTWHLRRAEGLVLRSIPCGEDYAVIATGDCCYAPQILEVNFDPRQSGTAV